MFITRFITGNLFCLFFFALICGLKKLLGKKIPLRYQYGVWGLLLLSIGAAFLPASLLRLFQLAGPAANESTLQATVTPNQASGLMPSLIQGSLVEQAIPLTTILGRIWICGMLLTMALYVVSFGKLIQIKRHAASPSKNIQALFSSCCKQAGIKGKVELLQSDLIEAPFSVRFRKNSVLLPARAIKGLTEQELRHILLHELMHIRHGDTVTNVFVCAGQVVYWFNPFVWLAFSRMRLDREAYCDWSVLSLLKDPDERTAYGSTLIKCARQGKGRLVHVGLSSGKTQMRYRIEKIAGFERENRRTVRLGVAAMLAAALLVLAQLPVLAAVSSHPDIFAPAFSSTEKELNRSALNEAEAIFSPASQRP